MLDQQIDYFGDLPDEIIVQLCKKMAVRDLCRLARTSKRLRHLIIGDDKIWESFVTNFATEVAVPERSNAFQIQRRIQNRFMYIDKGVRSLIYQGKISFQDFQWVTTSLLDSRLELTLTGGLVVPHSRVVLISRGSWYRVHEATIEFLSQQCLFALLARLVTFSQAVALHDSWAFDLLWETRVNSFDKFRTHYPQYGLLALAEGWLNLAQVYQIYHPALLTRYLNEVEVRSKYGETEYDQANKQFIARTWEDFLHPLEQIHITALKLIKQKLTLLPAVSNGKKFLDYSELEKLYVGLEWRPFQYLVTLYSADKWINHTAPELYQLLFQVDLCLIVIKKLKIVMDIGETLVDAAFAKMHHEYKWTNLSGHLRLPIKLLGDFIDIAEQALRFVSKFFIKDKANRELLEKLVQLKQADVAGASDEFRITLYKGFIQACNHFISSKRYEYLQNKDRHYASSLFRKQEGHGGY